MTKRILWQKVVDAAEAAADQVDIEKMAGDDGFNFKMEMPDYVQGAVLYVAYMSSFWTQLLERLADKDVENKIKAESN